LPLSGYIRREVPEPDEAQRVIDAKPTESAPLTLLRRGKSMVVLTMGLLAVSTCLNYLLTYIPTYSIKTLGLADWLGFAASIAASIVLMAATPLAGHFSDRVGQVRLMIPPAVGILLLSYPLFVLLTALPQIGTLVLVVMVLAGLKSMYYGPLGALMSSLFPPETRATGLAVGYNVGVAIFGGFTPLIVNWLIDLTGQAVAPAYWVMFAAAVSLVTLVILRGKYGKR
jgi:MHS family proline/betaine transporter-like MFS transporter